MTASHTAEAASDRYVSFSEINFEANMRAVLQHLMRYIDDPTYANPFWDRFKARLEKAEADAVPVADKLLLMHAHVYYMAELFEDAEDEAAIAALARLEQECF